MKISIKQYEYKEIEIASKEFELPTEVSYYFETGVRRSIRITPKFTTRNLEIQDKAEEVYGLDVICLYSSFECVIEKFYIPVSQIEEIYYSNDHKYRSLVVAFINGWLNKRTKEQFENDFNYILSELRK